MYDAVYWYNKAQKLAVCRNASLKSTENKGCDGTTHNNLSPQLAEIVC